MPSKVVAQLYSLPGVVHKRRGERKLLIQMLRNPDLLQYLRQLIAGCYPRSVYRHSLRLAQATDALSRAQQRIAACHPPRIVCPYLMSLLYAKSVLIYFITLQGQALPDVAASALPYAHLLLPRFDNLKLISSPGKSGGQWSQDHWLLISCHLDDSR